MRKVQATLAIAALFAAPLALLARTGCASPPCTMLCCLHQAHHGAMASMSDCRRETPSSSPCAGWRCNCAHGPDGSAAVPWLPLTLPSLNALALPGPAGAAAMTARTDFISAWPTKDPPPPRS